MKIHYFQRYHSKENVATANTMLLLSRFYAYSSDKFFRFLKSEIFSDAFEPEIIFNLQEKSKNSVPDATITQESFKIVVETKMSDWFSTDQLIRHLSSFGEERFKVLISLAPTKMSEEKKEDFETKLKEHNTFLKYPIIHLNTTFEKIVEGIQGFIDDKDFEIQDVIDDYLSYCYKDKLIADSWKRMKMQLTSTTFDFNVRENIYYNNVSRAYAEHDYLALYKEKSIRAVGKIIAIITATNSDSVIKFKTERGELNQERKELINKAIEDAKKYGYVLSNERYFFVDKFYETDFKKVSSGAPMGSRLFDLTNVLGLDKLPSTQEIANLLKSKTWN